MQTTARAVKYEDEYDADLQFPVSRSTDDHIAKYELPQEPQPTFTDDTEIYTDQHFGAPAVRHQIQPQIEPVKPLLPISSFARPAPELFTRLQAKRSAAAQRDAYTFAANDPDDAWSTLPARKKTRPKFAQLVFRVTVS